MATRLIEFKLQNGGSIWVEEEMPPDRGGLVAQYRSARNSAWLRQRMRRVFALEQHVAGVARSRERGLPHQGHGLHRPLWPRWTAAQFLGALSRVASGEPRSASPIPAG